MARRTAAGFTLLELALVMFIITLVLGGMLSPLSQRIEQQERENTQDLLEDIEDAIYGFAVANGRLPCPDCRACAGANDGVEDTAGNFCTVTEGNVPWSDLGTARTDAWGHAFSYSISTTAADFIAAGTVTPPGTCTLTPALSSIALCTTGNINVQDEGDTCPAAAPTVIATNVMAVVVSHGANAVSQAANSILIDVPTLCMELDNELTGDGDFIDSDYSMDDTTGYDDLVIWISPNVLKSRMLSAGRLP